MMTAGPKWTYLSLLGPNKKIYIWYELAQLSAGYKYEYNLTNIDWQHIHYIWKHCLVSIK